MNTASSQCPLETKRNCDKSGNVSTCYSNSYSDTTPMLQGAVPPVEPGADPEANRIREA